MLPTNPSGTVAPRTIAQTIDTANGKPALPANANGDIDLSKLDQPTQDFLRKQDPAGFDAAVARFKANGTSPSAPQSVGAPFGQEAGLETRAKGNADDWKSQQARASQATGDIALANIMEPLLDKFTSGQGAENLAKWKSFASTHGITVGKDATDAAQEFKKYASQMIVQQRASMGGSATDAAQAANEAGSSNLGIGNDPNKNILQYIRGNAQGMKDFAQAKNNFLKATGDDMVHASDFDNKFNQVYDPRILIFKNMSAPQKQSFVNDLTKSGQIDDFQNKLSGYNALMRQYK